jgi:hypothetical protein
MIKGFILALLVCSAVSLKSNLFAEFELEEDTVEATYKVYPLLPEAFTAIIREVSWNKSAGYFTGKTYDILTYKQSKDLNCTYEMEETFYANMSLKEREIDSQCGTVKASYDSDKKTTCKLSEKKSFVWSYKTKGLY